MPKKALSPHEVMNREFLAALRAGQARLGERDSDTARIMPDSKSTYYRRTREPELFPLRDLRILAKRYNWADWQVCRMLGVEYRGQTVEQEGRTT